MEDFLNISPGSVSVLGLMNDKEHKIHLLIDKKLVDSEYFGCHPCINTSSLKIRTRDILDIFLPHTGHKPVVVEL
jgi:Ala-tRNA(Pro) deacylase